MQFANIMLALGGDSGTIVPKTEVSASEIAVLRLIHGNDSVTDVEPVTPKDEEKRKRTSREEIRRLNEVYGRSRIQTHNGGEASPVQALFPGAAAQAIKNLDELDIPKEFYKAKSRVTADGSEQDADDSDGLDKMTKAELQEEAEKRGVEISSGSTKAEIIEALRAGDNEDAVFE